mmetsp:Transcript_7660/g.22710  ORF Transcript_7660/g.22710 Transcript_7660/m.22710 type:complete len:226 (+) Transcript_7660:196-873(+)
MSSLPRLSTSNDAAIARQLQEQSDALYAQQLVSAERGRTQERADAEFARRLNASQPGPPPAGPSRQVAPGRANCPRGCGLRPFQASQHQVIQCNGCGQRVAAGRRTLSCLRCDYDLCERPEPENPVVGLGVGLLRGVRAENHVELARAVGLLRGEAFDDDGQLAPEPHRVLHLQVSRLDAHSSSMLVEEPSPLDARRGLPHRTCTVMWPAVEAGAYSAVTQRPPS